MPLQPYFYAYFSSVLAFKSHLKSHLKISLWVQSLLKLFITITFTSQLYWSAHLHLAWITTSACSPKTWLPQVIIYSAEVNPSHRTIIASFKTPYITLHGQRRRKRKEKRQVKSWSTQSIHPVVGVFLNNHPLHLWPPYLSLAQPRQELRQPHCQRWSKVAACTCIELLAKASWGQPLVAGLLHLPVG